MTQSSLWAAIAALVISLNAGAAPSTYSFVVTATSGPLVGQSATGRFSFDESQIPQAPGTLVVSAENLFTDLEFEWNGIRYTEATANTGFIWYEDGSFFSALFGTNCGAAGCALSGGENQWIAAPGFGIGMGGFSPDAFSYGFPSAAQTGGGMGDIWISRATPVSEPRALDVLLLSLFIALSIAPRRRAVPFFNSPVPAEA